LAPVSNVPVYKGMLSDTPSLLLVSNFPNMINPTQMVKLSQNIACRFTRPFQGVKVIAVPLQARGAQWVPES